MVEYPSRNTMGKADTIAADTDSPDAVWLTISDWQESASAHLDRSAVAALVGQLQSWLARTAPVEAP